MWGKQYKLNRTSESEFNVIQSKFDDCVIQLQDSCWLFRVCVGTDHLYKPEFSASEFVAKVRIFHINLTSLHSDSKSMHNGTVRSITYIHCCAEVVTDSNQTLQKRMSPRDGSRTCAWTCPTYFALFCNPTVSIS